MERTDVITVDLNDQPLGQCEKMEAHEKGLLHRAFSVFIFNRKGAMLLQQRASSKYHSPGLWTNACCSHPQPGEDTVESAQRRLQEELGFNTPIEKQFDFVYRAEFENGLIEHEFDHVFTGEYDGQIIFNSTEVMDACYKSMDQIENELRTKEEDYTFWFKLAFPRIKSWWMKHYHQATH